MFDTNPRKYIVAGIVIIALFCGGFFLLSAFLPFYGAVIAPGYVKVLGNKKIIQHLEGGIVEKVLVRDGDTVKQGQTLIILKNEQVDANIDLLTGKLYYKLAERARLRAEAAMADSIKWPEELVKVMNDPQVSSILQEEIKIFDSKRTDLLNKISLYESQIIQLKKQRKGIEAQLSARKKILNALNEELSSKEELLREKYIDKPHILELRRKSAEAQGTCENLVQNIAEVDQKIEELQLRILNLRNSYKEEAIDELRKITDEIYTIREQLRPLLDTKKRMKITAPITGVVLNLRIHSDKSRVVKPGEPLMEIVPRNSEMVVEARVRPDEITKIYKNQPARVQLSAFDRRTTPPVPGTVIYVSADQVSSDTGHGVQAYYVAHVKIDSADLKKAGAYLYPGMPAICYLTTKRRTILDYLLDPLLQGMDKALRES